MTTQAAQVKCFPLSNKQLLISGPCLQKPLAHVSFLLLPVSSVSPPPSRCSLGDGCSPQSASRLMLDVTEPTKGWNLREREEKGRTRGAAGLPQSGVSLQASSDTPPHPLPSPPQNLTSEWFMRWRGAGGEVCMIASRASLVSAVFLTPRHTREMTGERKGGQCLCWR